MNTTVAAIPRNTNKPPKTSTNIAASDMEFSATSRSSGQASISVVSMTSHRAIRIVPSESCLNGRPHFHKGHTVIDAFHADFHVARYPGAIQTACCQ
jgi:hypothetical protein